MNNQEKIRRAVLISAFAAIVAVLGLLPLQIGIFKITIALIPIVIGAILFGPFAGAFLGFVMGVVVLLTDSAFFFQINPFATVLICLLKSALAGLIAGYVYKLIRNKKVSCTIASILTPIINSGVFGILVLIFFYPTLVELAAGENAFIYLITGMIGINFVIEFIVNAVLTPTIYYFTKQIGYKYISKRKK